MKATATAKFIRIAPRKTRLVVDLVRGMSVTEAQHQLTFSKKHASDVVLKVLNSAVANAQNNLHADTKGWSVIEARVNQGPVIYRYAPKAHGRATPVRKRMSHIMITIGDGKSEEVKVQSK